jgi:hypothetical protein
MEAATPLHKPRVRTIGDRLAIDGLVVEDEAAVRLAREREQAGDDAASVVRDAIEIGARVLDREQTGANAELVKSELGKASREVEAAFVEKAREVAEHFGTKVDEVFGPESGQLAKELEKLFSDGSSASVQNRVREVVAEAMAKYRADLVSQFSAADEKNPLAEFKAATVRTIREAGERQDVSQRALVERMGELEKQLQGLRLENEKLEELELERERGTAKGRTFEELVAEAVDEIAIAQGDDAEAVGDTKGAIGKTGDVLVSIDAAAGPARGRIVFEAKDRKLSKPKALEELDRALDERDADFAVLVVPSEDEIPARLQELREYNGDKLIATLEPGDGARLGLELAYRLARARVLMARSTGEGVDASAVHDRIERALAALDDVRRVKSQLSGAESNIDNARQIVEAVAARVRSELGEIDVLVRGPEQQTPADQQQTLDGSAAS